MFLMGKRFLRYDIETNACHDVCLFRGEGVTEAPEQLAVGNMSRNAGGRTRNEGDVENAVLMSWSELFNAFSRTWNEMRILTYFNLQFSFQS